MPSAAWSRRRRQEKGAGSWRALPLALRQLVILLRVDLDVIAGGIGMRHGYTGLDHFLQQQYEVGLLEYGRLSERPAGMQRTAAVIILAELSRTSCSELGDACELAIGLAGIDV